LILYYIILYIRLIIYQLLYIDNMTSIYDELIECMKENNDNDSEKIIALEKQIDNTIINYDYNTIFIVACEYGYFDIAKKIYKIFLDNKITSTSASSGHLPSLSFKNFSTKW